MSIFFKDAIRSIRMSLISHQAAAIALRKIGKAAAGALIRATAAHPGDCDQRYAILSLGSLGEDAPREAIDCLIRILRSNDNDRRFFAAIALGRLGEHARRAREALEMTPHDDFSMIFAVSWALMEVGR